jgi:hypothetical protein
MNLQQKTLMRYRYYFPHETLREIAFKTNINFTRVFRLYNGLAMRLEEFEIFSKFIEEKESSNPKSLKVKKVFEELIPSLTDQELDEWIEIFHRRLYRQKLISQFSSEATSILA